MRFWPFANFEAIVLRIGSYPAPHTSNTAAAQRSCVQHAANLTSTVPRYVAVHPTRAMSCSGKRTGKFLFSNHAIFKNTKCEARRRTHTAPRGVNTTRMWRACVSVFRCKRLAQKGK